jgi:hypothetical protein
LRLNSAHSWPRLFTRARQSALRLPSLTDGRGWFSGDIRPSADVDDFGGREVATLRQQVSDGEDAFGESGGVDPIRMVGILRAEDQLVAAVGLELNIFRGFPRSRRACPGCKLT